MLTRSSLVLLTASVLVTSVQIQQSPLWLNDTDDNDTTTSSPATTQFTDFEETTTEATTVGPPVGIACDQWPDEEDDYEDNDYGDMICIFDDREDDILIARITVTGSYSDSFPTSFEGYEVSKVQVLNWGRLHAFVGGVEIFNDGSGGRISLNYMMEYEHQQPRLFVEVYGRKL